MKNLIGKKIKKLLFGLMVINAVACSSIFSMEDGRGYTGFQPEDEIAARVSNLRVGINSLDNQIVRQTIAEKDRKIESLYRELVALKQESETLSMYNDQLRQATRQSRFLLQNLSHSASVNFQRERESYLYKNSALEAQNSELARQNTILRVENIKLQESIKFLTNENMKLSNGKRIAEDDLRGHLEDLKKREEDVKIFLSSSAQAGCSERSRTGSPVGGRKKRVAVKSGEQIKSLMVYIDSLTRKKDMIFANWISTINFSSEVLSKVVYGSSFGSNPRLILDSAKYDAGNKQYYTDFSSLNDTRIKRRYSVCLNEVRGDINQTSFLNKISRDNAFASFFVCDFIKAIIFYCCSNGTSYQKDGYEIVDRLTDTHIIPLDLIIKSLVCGNVKICIKPDPKNPKNKILEFVIPGAVFTYASTRSGYEVKKSRWRFLFCVWKSKLECYHAAFDGADYH